MIFFLIIFFLFVLITRSIIIGASDFSGVNLHPWFTVIALKQMIIKCTAKQ